MDQMLEANSKAQYAAPKVVTRRHMVPTISVNWCRDGPGGHASQEVRRLCYLYAILLVVTPFFLIFLYKVTPPPMLPITHFHFSVSHFHRGGKRSLLPLLRFSAAAMALLMRRLWRASALGLGNALREESNWKSSGRRFPFGAAAAISSGIAVYYFCSSPTMQAQLEQKSEEPAGNVALDPEKWLEFKLQETARVSHDTQLFRFTFDPAAKLGLDIASCILTRAPIGEESEGRRKYVIRPYTPISDPDSKGYFDLLIKVYPDGKMSQHLASLKPGDVVEVKGPIEKLRYSPNMKMKIGMIAGGTGITPMLQVIKAILKNPDDNTQVSVLYANISPDDILLKRELDRLSASYPNFKVFYTVDKPSEDWRGGAGYISKDMIVKGLPGPAEDSLILVCGPPGMMKHISGDKAKDRSQGELAGLLKEVGYTEEMVYKF